MKSYYQQMKRLVMPILEGYQNDLLVHDRKVLQHFTGTFIAGVRSTGTNLLKFEGDLKVDPGRALTINAFLFDINKHFFVGQNGVVRKVTKEIAQRHFAAAIERGTPMRLYA